MLRKIVLISAPPGISQKKYDQSIKLIEKGFLHFASALKNNLGLTNSICDKYNQICSWPMPTYDPLLLLQCDSQEVEPEWRYVAHNISKVFSLGQHLLPVDDKEVVALPHQALCVVLEDQVMRKRVLFSAPSGISRKRMIKV
jgi:hypothetical protein